MRYFKRRRNSSYGDLWLNTGTSMTPVIEAAKSSDEILIEGLMLRADLCVDLESYVETLCEGMEQILESKTLLKIAKANPLFESKIKRIGSDIVEKSQGESDLFYLGVFATLKLKENWLDKQFYKILSKLLGQIMTKGFKFSDLLRRKIKAKLVKFLINNNENHEFTHLASMLRCG